ncbi:MAG: hypothetical protein ACRDLO_05230, partial [Solirubrobacterales bacterium]
MDGHAEGGGSKRWEGLKARARHELLRRVSGEAERLDRQLAAGLGELRRELDRRIGERSAEIDDAVLEATRRAERLLD